MILNQEMKAPATVLYRGNLFDTASLVGLANMHMSVGKIVFIGELTAELEKYIRKTLDFWLIGRGLPAVNLIGTLNQAEWDRIIPHPYHEWGWKEKECRVAISLAGLPFPPAMSHLRSV